MPTNNNNNNSLDTGISCLDASTGFQLNNDIDALFSEAAGLKYYFDLHADTTDDDDDDEQYSYRGVSPLPFCTADANVYYDNEIASFASCLDFLGGEDNEGVGVGVGVGDVHDGDYDNIISINLDKNGSTNNNEEDVRNNHSNCNNNNINNNDNWNDSASNNSINSSHTSDDICNDIDGGNTNDSTTNESDDENTNNSSESDDGEDSSSSDIIDDTTNCNSTSINSSKRGKISNKDDIYSNTKDSTINESDNNNYNNSESNGDKDSSSSEIVVNNTYCNSTGNASNEYASNINDSSTNAENDNSNNTNNNISESIDSEDSSSKSVGNNTNCNGTCSNLQWGQQHGLGQAWSFYVHPNNGAARMYYYVTVVPLFINNLTVLPSRGGRPKQSKDTKKRKERACGRCRDNAIQGGMDTMYTCAGRGGNGREACDNYDDRNNKKNEK